jgi:HSP90 family molecular chaperone
MIAASAREAGESPLIARCAALLHGVALLAEGSELIDPVAFTRTLTDVMTDFTQRRTA